MKRGRPSRKPREHLFSLIVLLVFLLAVGFIGLQLINRDPKPIKSPAGVQSKPKSPPSEEPGYASFYSDKLQIGFLFPKDQDPLTASKEINDAELSVKSRDFLIDVFNGPGFEYSPWPETSITCVYDGALNDFASQNGEGCDFVKEKLSEQQFLANSFIASEKTKHVFIAPLQDRKYFIVFSVEYLHDCGSAQNVCNARSEIKLRKLRDFVTSVVQKNPELFSL